MAKLSVERTLVKAKSHIKRGELAEARKLYSAVLSSFPNNKKAQQGLDSLAGGYNSVVKQGPSQAVIGQLINLYNQGQLEVVVEQAQNLTVQYPVSFMVWNILGAANKGLGRIVEATNAFMHVTKYNPNFPDGFSNLGATLADQGKLDEAITAYKRAIRLKPNYFEAYNNMGVALRRQEKLEASINSYKKALSLKPDYTEAYNNLGVALAQKGNLTEAIVSYKRAISLKPDYAEAYSNMGNALKDQSKLKEAIEAYNKSLSLKPDYAESYYNMGIVLKQQGKLEEAIEAYNKSLSLKPDYAEAYNNMGISLNDQSKLKEAIEAYNKSLSLKPDYAEAYINMGIVYQKQDKPEEAIDVLNKALLLKPDYAEAYNNMGIVFQQQGKLEEAIEALNKALSLKPDYAEAYHNMGIVFQEQGKLEEAIEAYKKALSLKPNYAEAYNSMGIVFQQQGKLEEAIEAYKKALSLKPDFETARMNMLFQQTHICDWDSIEKARNFIPDPGTSDRFVNPFVMFSLEDAPKRHRIRAEAYVKSKYLQEALPLREKVSKVQDRIRIGYFSTDFKEHPVAYLIAKVLEQHDRNKFEVFGYSLHGNIQSALRQRLVKSFDSFVDVQGLNSKDIALRARQDEIDIAIDLNGYTENNRAGIFVHRVAPIQINYLGYPGTMGADLMDYIIADKNLIPTKSQKYYSEKPIYLPYTYMPTDNTREVSKRSLTRKEMGLPDDAFVFCCFNNNYKISGLEFDIWMRLLTKVAGSVLWLRRSNKLSDISMRKEAQKRNIDPSRIIFADRMEMDEHLARQKLADLFIDTFVYNAHTTATEALWAGLPVVTKLGQGFAARVAGSLLNAVGLPELITETEKSYEALILHLATNPDDLSKIKQKLATNRLSKPLFDTEQYTRHLEEGYRQAYQNYFDGKAPQTIIVQK